jgi:dephospho-CoA kinase
MDRRDPGATPRILGLTGPIGCGKTTVGDLLGELGALERIDADRVVHELMAAGTATSREVGRAFGPEALKADGSVDRAALARIVFADAVARTRLEAIVHPAVRRAIRQRIEELKGRRGIVVVDAVRLLQSDLLPLCDWVWVVRCDEGEQRRRLRENRGMDEESIEGRLAAQPSFDHPRVTRVIDNSGSVEELRRQVERMWSELQSAAR